MTLLPSNMGGSPRQVKPGEAKFNLMTDAPA